MLLASSVAAPVRTSRRRMLTGSLVLGALFVTGSGLAVLRTGGYELPAGHKGTLAVFSTWQWVFAAHVARRIAAPDRPDDLTIPTPEEVDVAGFMDGYIARMPGALRRDLLRGFAYIEHIAPLSLGYLKRFTHLSPDDQDRVLHALEVSEHPLLRGAFEGLKALVFMGYYRDARTWKIVGYEGPLIRRPQGGWTR